MIEHIMNTRLSANNYNYTVQFVYNGISILDQTIFGLSKMSQLKINPMRDEHKPFNLSGEPITDLNDFLGHFFFRPNELNFM